MLGRGAQERVDRALGAEVDHALRAAVAEVFDHGTPVRGPFRKGADRSSSGGLDHLNDVVEGNAVGHEHRRARRRRVAFAIEEEERSYLLGETRKEIIDVAIQYRKRGRGGAALCLGGAQRSALQKMHHDGRDQ